MSLISNNSREFSEPVKYIDSDNKKSSGSVSSYLSDFVSSYFVSFKEQEKPVESKALNESDFVIIAKSSEDSDFVIIPNTTPEINSLHLSPEEKRKLVLEACEIESCKEEKAILTLLMEIADLPKGRVLLENIRKDGGVRILIRAWIEGNNIRRACFNPISRFIQLHPQNFFKEFAYMQKSFLLFELANLTFSREFLQNQKMFLEKKILLEDYVRSSETTELHTCRIHYEIVEEGIRLNPDYWPREIPHYSNWMTMTQNEWWNKNCNSEHTLNTTERAKRLTKLPDEQLQQALTNIQKAIDSL